jgi:dTDP-4-amino-4,6-dideoxygalactose transaminase
MQAMLDEGIATRRGVMCTHREPAYSREMWSCGVPAANCECPAGSCKRLSASEQAQDRTIILPLFHEMTEAEQDFVVHYLEECVQPKSFAMCGEESRGVKQ